MIDMKYEEMELKEFTLPKPAAPKYPHGLRISLGPEELKKLGIQSTPKVEEKYMMDAKVEVVEVTAEDEKGDESSYRVVLQIKELDLKSEDKKEESTSTTKVLYGE